MPFRTVWVVLPFKHWWWQSFSELTTEEHRGCISHWCAFSSTSHDQQHIATSSKSSATTQQQLQSGPTVDTHPLRNSWKWTRRNAYKARCTNRATITKALMITCQEKGAYHILSRPEQVIMVRLRIEHNRWNAHMHKKLKMVPLAVCLFGEEDLHILQNCKRHDQERSSASPTETTLHQKLHGDGQHSSSL